MADERTTHIHLYERVPTAAEITRDILIAVIGRSSEYDLGTVNPGKAKTRLDLITRAYEVILKKVKDEGIE